MEARASGGEARSLYAGLMKILTHLVDVKPTLLPSKNHLERAYA
jgi:hypothetical protein